MRGSEVLWPSDAPFTLDVAEFRSVVRCPRTVATVARGVELYRGDLLPECYDEWITPERDRLREEFTRLLEDGIALLEGNHDYAGALRLARRLVEHEPLHEEAHQVAMRLLALGGDRAGVARTYRTYAATMERQLGREPSRVIRELYESVLGSDTTVQRPAGRKPVTVHPHNLPAYPTPLVGREREVETTREMLRSEEVRLLTLTGTAGIGKTRLAVQVARELLPDFDDGAFLVGLAPLRDPSLVATTIARVLGVPEDGGCTPVETLKGYLGARSMLLVLDNLEHLLEAAPLVSELLLAAPQLKVLATSRERLRLYGEHTFPVLGLAAPDPSPLLDARTARRYGAVSLFVQRARAADPRFVLTDADAPALAELCAHLDGLPLAIELAAARAGTFSTGEILARLGRRFEVLGDGAVDLPHRHRTLGAAIDWSYDLLAGNERRLFARLAVFVGGCTPEAAAAIAGARSDSELPSLGEKSLLQPLEGVRGVRYRMLETIREYALERLEASGESEDLRRRHAEYFLALAEEAEPELIGPRQAEWLARLEEEHSNLRAALSWFVQRGEAEGGLRLAGTLGQFWYVHGHFREGLQWIERVLPGARQSTPARAKALEYAGVFREKQGDINGATALLEESLSLARALGYTRGVIGAVSDLAAVAVAQRDYDRARELYEEYLTLCRELGDTRGVALALNNLSHVALVRREYAEASLLSKEAFALTPEVGDAQLLASTLHNLGYASLGQREYDEATRFYADSIAPSRVIGYREGIAWALEGFADIAGVLGHAERAARLYGAAETLRETIQAPLRPADAPLHDQYLTAARGRLDGDTWDAAWAEGRAMTMEQAVAYALQQAPGT